ncbi:hypothetical protein JCM1841_006767 [Sporobolomyces salmonicolor]
MDRSFGASTSVLFATPSPLDRKARSSPSLSSSTLLGNAQLAQSLTGLTRSAAVQPLSFNPANASGSSSTTTTTPAATTKAVRFSPAHPSTTAAFSTAYSSAPPSRMQSVATPPRSYSSPSLAALQRTSSYGLGNGTALTPPRTQQQHFPAQQMVQSALATPIKAVQEINQEIKHKLEVMPLGRGEAAKRLRVNAVLLVAWWVASRTTMYRFAAGHLVALAPSLDTPLHIFETLLLLLLCYNILDSLRALQRLSAIPAGYPSSADAPRASRPGPGPTRSFSLSTPVRSSPKTRPSPSPTVSRFVGPSSPSLSRPSSPFRSSALASPSPPTPQTPTSALGKSVSASLAMSTPRRSLLGLGTPTGSPLARSVNAGGVPKDEVGGALLAYEARHSPVGTPKIAVNTQQGIDRLFE